jgi:hypothetical protein
VHREIKKNLASANQSTPWGRRNPTFVVGELGPAMPVNRKVPNLGPRLSIVDANRKRIARLGGEDGPGLASGKFLAPHGIALDSKDDMYAGMRARSA